MLSHNLCYRDGSLWILNLNSNWKVFYTAAASVIKLVSVDNLPESKVFSSISILYTTRFFFFSGHCVKYEILGPRPGIKLLGPQAVRARSPKTGLPRNSPQILSLEKNSRKNLPCKMIHGNDSPGPSQRSWRHQKWQNTVTSYKRRVNHILCETPQSYWLVRLVSALWWQENGHAFGDAYWSRQDSKGRCFKFALKHNSMKK